MIEAKDFASLLQLGAGLGIGLSFFRSGFDRKQKALRKRFGQITTAYGNATTRADRKAVGELASARTRFASGCGKAEKLAQLFQALALLGGLANMGLLIAATVWGDYQLNTLGIWGGLWWSLGYFALLLLAMEMWLWLAFRPIAAELLRLEKQKGLAN